VECVVIMIIVFKKQVKYITSFYAGVV